jgi:acyl-CoA thioester hydrolase
MTEHRHTLRVYYEDTDFGGVVYYANYLKFYERGRSEALRALGVDQVAMKAEGLVFVVRRAEVDYIAPARFDDMLEVLTSVDKVGGASAVMAQRILRDGVVLSEASIRVACMDSSGRPARFPDAMRRSLKALD